MPRCQTSPGLPYACSEGSDEPAHSRSITTVLAARTEKKK